MKNLKNLLDPVQAEEIKARLANLQPDSLRQWGKMNVAQMLAHCSLALQSPLGEVKLPRMRIGRLIGWFIKPLALGDDKPMRRNSPTVTGMEIVDARDFAKERERLLGLIDRFTHTDLKDFTTHPHGFFGVLTPEEWAILQYKHLDHHLNQFSA